MIDGCATFNLLAFHLFVQKFFEQLINERSIDARYTACPQSPTILKDVLVNHLYASLMNAALAGTEWPESLRRFLRPGSAIFVKHPIQCSDDYADACRIGILAAGAPTIECREQYLFSA